MPINLIQNSYRKTIFTTAALPGELPVVQESTGTDVQMGQTSRTTSGDANWRTKVFKKQDATNTYRVTGFRDVHAPSARCRAINSAGGYPIEVYDRRIQMDSSYTLLGPTTDADLLADVSARMKRKLRTKTGEMRALTPIVEFRDLARSAEGIANFCWDFVTLITNLRKFKPKVSARDFERMMADAWLNWNFGIAPLITDVDNAVVAMETFLARKDYPVRLSSAKEKTWSNGSRTSLSNFQNVEVGCTSSVEHKLSYRITAGFDIKILSSNNYTAWDHYGINLKRVPVSLYELTGFSWMADYFVNIGAFLEDAWYTPPGVTRYISVARKYEAKAHLRLDYRPTHPKAVLTDQSVTDGKWLFYEFERSSLASLPSIDFRFKTRDETANYAVSKLLNLLAILRK